MDVIVRLGEPSDAWFVGQDGYISRDELLRKISQGEVFVLEVEGWPAGYLRLDFLWSKIPFIALIWMSEPFRGKGHSRLLLGFVEHTLVELGCEQLLSSSQVDEPAPQAWHRHMGFKECGVINGLNHGGIGEIFFRKRLL